MDAEQRDEPYTIDIQRVLELLPHRYPFLMVDRIVEVRRGQSAIGIKNVTYNEPHFTGHFPGSPIMPGVLIIEAMAQTSGALVVESLGKEMEGKLVYFMTVDNARFRRPVVPGDRLEVHVNKIHARGLVWKFQGEAKVDGKLCAEAKFSAMILDNDK